MPDSSAFDLIHEFLVEEWPAVERRIDAARGTGRAYLYAAFQTFARRQIARDRRVTPTLAWPTLLVRDVAVAESVEHPIELAEAAAAVSEALAELPELDRRLVSRYLAGEGSERALASDTGVTRHSFRTGLARGLGAVAQVLARKGLLDDFDSSAVCFLWRDGMTLEEAAAGLGSQVPRVERARARVLRWLAVTYAGARRADERGIDMPNDFVGNPADAIRFWKGVLLHERRDPAVLQAVRARARELVELLRTGRVTFEPGEPVRGGRVMFDAREQEQIAARRDWVAKVVEALSDGVAPTADDARALAELLDRRRTDEGRVGDAFVDPLLRSLPPEFADWAAWFHGVEPVSDEEKDRLLAHPSAAALGDDAREMARYGLTPMSVFTAASGISMMVERLVRRQRLDGGSVLLPGSRARGDELKGVANVVPYDRLLLEVEKQARCTQPVADKLLLWMVQASVWVAQFFGRFSAVRTPERDLVQLGRLPRRLWDVPLVVAWALPEANPTRAADVREPDDAVGVMGTRVV